MRSFAVGLTAVCALSALLDVATNDDDAAFGFRGVCAIAIVCWLGKGLLSAVSS